MHERYHNEYDRFLALATAAGIKPDSNGPLPAARSFAEDLVLCPSEARAVALLEANKPAASTFLDLAMHYDDQLGILRCLFDFAYWYRRLNSARFPIAAFADEAHIYLRDGDPICEAPKNSAERIAKEGRKYGISLTVISQRPREVSGTILSQCNSFLCLRISNPDDQAYVRNLLPDSVRGIASMFSTLRRGECILLGDSVMMPTRIKIDPPHPAPVSEDASFYKTWNEAPKELDFARVLKAWRDQEVNP